MASLYERNRKLVLASNDFCAVCGGYVDKSLKKPHPMSGESDHIIPKSKGGSDALSNLQLVHRKCNLEKSNKIGFKKQKSKSKNKFEQLVIF